jgi:hypothetical protein
MRLQIVSLVASLNIGLFLPVMYANGAACHLVYILSGCGIGFSCFLSISLLMSRLNVPFAPKTFAAKQVFSLGYLVAPALAYSLVLLMVKTVSKH